MRVGKDVSQGELVLPENNVFLAVYQQELVHAVRRRRVVLASYLLGGQLGFVVLGHIGELAVRAQGQKLLLDEHVDLVLNFIGDLSRSPSFTLKRQPTSEETGLVVKWSTGCTKHSVLRELFFALSMKLLQKLVGLVLKPRAQNGCLLHRNKVKVRHKLFDHVGQRDEVDRVEPLDTLVLELMEPQHKTRAPNAPESKPRPLTLNLPSRRLMSRSWA